MKENTGTIFKVYLLNKTSPSKQEGFVKLWKHKGKLQKGKLIPFDYTDQIPRKNPQGAQGCEDRVAPEGTKVAHYPYCRSWYRRITFTEEGD
jgi:hypothetical protein